MEWPDLDVSVNDASAVQVCQPLQHLLHDGGYLYFSKALPSTGTCLKAIVALEESSHALQWSKLSLFTLMMKVKHAVWRRRA